MLYEVITKPNREGSSVGVRIVDIGDNDDRLQPDDFRYPSYVQDILGPMCFDYGFGPFRWVCASGKPEDLDKTDAIAMHVLEDIMANSPEEIQLQMQDNITWIRDAKRNNFV